MGELLLCEEPGVLSPPGVVMKLALVGVERVGVGGMTRGGSGGALVDREGFIMGFCSITAAEGRGKST